jgi:1,4-dihydroxy-2-naphthoyl-CoA hydrolase
MKKFTHQMMIHLSDTDASGVIFFPKLFEKCIITLETFLKTAHLEGALVTNKVAFPVINASAQYYAPIMPYEELNVTMNVTRVGQTSVSFVYQFINTLGLLAAEATLVHVCVDMQERSKKELPLEWSDVFNTLVQK